MLALGYSVKSDAQIRQWRHRYAGRAPNPENCVGIELATDGDVDRRDLRPEDWHLIWPELAADNDPIDASDDAQPPNGTRDGEEQGG